jgi:hypothetical protein
LKGNRGESASGFRDDKIREYKKENTINYENGYVRDPLKDDPLTTSMMETVI